MGGFAVQDQNHHIFGGDTGLNFLKGRMSLCTQFFKCCRYQLY